MDISTLKTERLLLRKIEVTDASFFYELFNSKDWLEFIGDRNIKTIADAEKQITDKYIPSYTKNGYGSYLVLDTETKVPVGTCGMYKRDNLDYPDLGFAFLPEYLGKGYGFEAGSAVLKEAKQTLDISKILAFTVSYNVASIKLLEKLGFENCGDYFFEGDANPLLLFERDL